MERICVSLQRQGTISSFDESTLKGAISKEKMQREIEWQRLHPGMDALLAHRKTNYEEKENGDDGEEDSDAAFTDEEMISVPKKRGSTAVKRGSAATPATRGRGRGRGRGASSATLSMTTDAPQMPSSAPIAPRWPPRR